FGDPETSAFPVNYDENLTIGELKNVIFGKVGVFYNVKAKDLTIYKVNIDLNSDNPQRTALSDQNADIEKDLNGQVLLPTRKVKEIFTEFSHDHIHIIVGVPEFSATSASIFDYSQLKRQNVTLSKISQKNLDELLNHLHFRQDVVNITVALTKNFDRPFVWDEQNEDQHAEDQKDETDEVIQRGYMSYLNENVSISSKYVWYNSKLKKDLLNVNYAALPYSISGTTDVLVMDRHFVGALNFRSGIRAGFKLKKNIQESDTTQAIAELIATNIISNHAVFIVLTDLNNTWMFYWLTDDRKVMMSSTDSLNALNIIESALSGTSKITANFPIGMRSNYFRHMENTTRKSIRE
ncbi:7875_t:CDS:2, partial [Acaulospora morrowiae]